MKMKMKMKFFFFLFENQNSAQIRLLSVLPWSLVRPCQWCLGLVEGVEGERGGFYSSSVFFLSVFQFSLLLQQRSFIHPFPSFQKKENSFSMRRTHDPTPFEDWIGFFLSFCFSFFFFFFSFFFFFFSSRDLFSFIFLTPSSSDSHLSIVPRSLPCLDFSDPPTSGC